MRRYSDCLPLRKLFVLVIGVLLLACGCEQAPEATGPSFGPAHTKAAARPASEKANVVDLTDGPVSTFERACSRCHGPHGSSFGDDFARLADERLLEFVEKMMQGPAQLQPTPVQLEAMAAYQRSLRDGRPFICVTNAAAFLSGKDTALQGEVTPGASVQLKKTGARTTAAIEGMVWTLAQPPRTPLVLIASDGSLQVRLDFPAAIWSK